MFCFNMIKNDLLSLSVFMETFKAIFFLTSVFALCSSKRKGRKISYKY